MSKHIIIGQSTNINVFSWVLFFFKPGVPRVSDILLSSTRNIGYGSSARYEPCSKTNFLTIYFRWRGGKEPHFRFGVPANHLASLFSPLVSGDLRLLGTNTCWYPLCDPHSPLTVTLWRLDTVYSNTRSSNFISQWDITWQFIYTYIYKPVSQAYWTDIFNGK